MCYRIFPVADLLKIARGLGKRILMLQIYYDLELDQLVQICNVTNYFAEIQ